MVGVDDVVADLELDVLEDGNDVQALDGLFDYLGNDTASLSGPGAPGSLERRALPLQRP